MCFDERLLKKQIHPKETPKQVDYRKKCPRCEEVVDPEDSYCPVCGLDLERFIVCPNCNCVYDAEYECPDCGMVLYDNVERYRRQVAYQRRSDAIACRIYEMEMEEKYPTRTSKDDLLNRAYRGGSVTPR